MELKLKDYFFPISRMFRNSTYGRVSDFSFSADYTLLLVRRRGKKDAGEFGEVL